MTLIIRSLLIAPPAIPERSVPALRRYVVGRITVLAPDLVSAQRLASE